MTSTIPAQNLGIGDEQTAQRIGELVPGFTTLEAIKTEPTVRVRLQHSHSLKEGWRLSETTVEWTGEGDPDWKTIERALMECHYYGDAEADSRNRPDAPNATSSGE